MLDAIEKYGIGRGSFTTQTVSIFTSSSWLTSLFVHAVCTWVTFGRRWKSNATNGTPFSWPSTTPNAIRWSPCDVNGGTRQ